MASTKTSPDLLQVDFRRFVSPALTRKAKRGAQIFEQRRMLAEEDAPDPHRVRILFGHTRPLSAMRSRKPRSSAPIGMRFSGGGGTRRLLAERGPGNGTTLSIFFRSVHRARLPEIEGEDGTRSLRRQRNAACEPRGAEKLNIDGRCGIFGSDQLSRMISIPSPVSARQRDRVFRGAHLCDLTQQPSDFA